MAEFQDWDCFHSWKGTAQHNAVGNLPSSLVCVVCLFSCVSFSFSPHSLQWYTSSKLSQQKSKNILARMEFSGVLWRNMFVQSLKFKQYFFILKFCLGQNSQLGSSKDKVRFHSHSCPQVAEPFCMCPHRCLCSVSLFLVPLKERAQFAPRKGFRLCVQPESCYCLCAVQKWQFTYQKAEFLL